MWSTNSFISIIILYDYYYYYYIYHAIIDCRQWVTIIILCILFDLGLHFIIVSRGIFMLVTRVTYNTSWILQYLTLARYLVWTRISEPDISDHRCCIAPTNCSRWRIYLKSISNDAPEVWNRKKHARNTETGTRVSYD